MPDTAPEPVLLPRPRSARFTGRWLSEGPVTEIVGQASELPSQGYRLTVADDRVVIDAADAAGAFYGRRTLDQLRAEGGRVPEATIEDWPSILVRGVMLDVSRDKVPTMETLEALVDRLASWKVNHLELYMEHTFAYPGHEEVWAEASPFTAAEVRALDAFCRARHIELAANQNTLGHMERWLRHERYRPLAIAPDGFEMWGRHRDPMTVDPAKPGSLALARELLGSLVPNFGSARVHVGLDEPWELPAERYGDYVDYVRRLRDVPELEGREMLIWGDIVAHEPASVAGLPDGVTVCEWGYEAGHPFDERARVLADAGRPFWLCPGTSSWNSILGRSSNARANIAEGVESAVAHGAAGLLVTDWGDNGHLQHLPVSETWFAFAAAAAWCPETNLGVDLAQAVDACVFDDRAGHLGALLLSLGDLHRMVEPQLPNASILTATLISPRLRMGEGRTEGMIDDDLARVLDRLERARDDLAGVDSGRADSALVVSELRASIDLVHLLVRDARARLAAGGRIDQVDASTRSGLAGELASAAERHRERWLGRNRPGGLDDSVARLDALRTALLE